jgi:hypothetical protein
MANQGSVPIFLSFSWSRSRSLAVMVKGPQKFPSYLFQARAGHSTATIPSKRSTLLTCCVRRRVSDEYIYHFSDMTDQLALLWLTLPSNGPQPILPMGIDSRALFSPHKSHQPQAS